MIRPTGRFTIDTAEAENTDRSTLLADGRPVGHVRGSHIDAQFVVGEVGHVLFVSFDDLFGAILTIHFVDADGRLRDEVKLGHATEQGLVTDLAVDGDRIRFAFPGSEVRRVRVGREDSLFGLRRRWLHLER